MAMRKLLLLLKPFDVYAPPHGANPQILHHSDSRRKVHLETIKFCQTILEKKPVEWKAVERDGLSQPIKDVDLVVTVGGDGTLLQASHFMDDRIPILGVNSDPTRNVEVEQFSNEFNATRSTGRLCAATVENFEQLLNGILEGQTASSKIKRISISVNTHQLPTYALNDILVAHPCPAALSTFSFRIRKDDQPCSPLVNSRSSGLRVSTAAGSTAAMYSAGGFLMPILSQDLQYMVREPISPGPLLDLMHGVIKHDQDLMRLMHGVIKHDQVMDITWSSKEGVIYIDGYHVNYAIKDGDTIEISCKAPILNIFLPDLSLVSAL